MARYCTVLLYAAVGVLLVLGLVMLATISPWVTDEKDLAMRQAVMALCGTVAALIAARFSQDPLRKLAPCAYALACVLLVLCFVPGIAAPLYGSNRWIQLPVIGNFQPSELAKLVVVLCLATWYARWQPSIGSFWRGFVVPGMIAAVPLGLIAIETDVGSALALAATVAAIMFCIGVRLRFMLPIAAAAILGACWYVGNDPVRWKRIEAWQDLEAHKLGTGMQQWRSLVAFGNGGPTGAGLGNGSEKFANLEHCESDFIFPIIGEELGLPGTITVVSAFVMIALAGYGIAMRARDTFSRCLAVGITSMIVVPAIVNIAVTTAAIPNDGLPLPFVSYGGTSLVISLAGLGLLVGIHRRARTVSAVPSMPLKAEKRFAVRL
jgi:cell division protein FtsW